MELSQGTMSARKIIHWDDQVAHTIQQIVEAFLYLGDAVATRWIETQNGVLLLQLAPENPASGAIYVFDRKHGDWYMLSFEGCEDQFTSEQFDRVFSEYKLFRYVEQPALLLAQMSLASA